MISGSFVRLMSFRVSFLSFSAFMAHQFTAPRAFLYLSMPMTMSTSCGKKSSILSILGNLSTYPWRAVTTMSPEAVTLARAVFLRVSSGLVPFL